LKVTRRLALAAMSGSWVTMMMVLPWAFRRSEDVHDLLLIWESRLPVARRPG